ncbi:RecB family exonuclease [Parvularcula bermudensis HTCC2503]|uniref:CRISPR-associated exonuclease Cas4 n=1 Tax=Parvularcula bermudensis (strain ATCC BAA-594 / HTCC2503 / KCTC 12087) TaxID=314260 RepID=E0TGH3_PARBH|nr:CRISPR-associated protein Cas4 [Parvularcula bermudensis]ADM09592.1 RecB family exonuclease [Parvularcula bermudensis HTCC2503]
MLPPPDQHSEDTLTPISALQHHLFCPRQCALIHVERIWSEDSATAQGRLLHERVDGGKPDRREGIKIVRGMVLRSLTLKLSGKADVVEFHGQQPYPVEYKRGRPKRHRADEVQLCAQALCLEEMFGLTVPEGALFYGETRKRTVVSIDQELRRLTLDVIADCRTMIGEGRTPPPRRTPACRRCSLVGECCPDRLEKPPSVSKWLLRQLVD